MRHQVLEETLGPGLGHRDIKPENLLLFQGQVKIVDLGFARLAELDSQTNSVLGTPVYAPPEAFDRRLQPTVDIYCLAGSYIHLRTGQFPFGRDAYQVLQRKRDNYFHTTGLEPWEIEALRPALTADPDQRSYATAGELATALARPPQPAARPKPEPAKPAAKQLQAAPPQQQREEAKPATPSSRPRDPERVTNSLGALFARIPAGEFLMGSPEGESGRSDNEFQHPVRITKAFYMGIYPVTVGEFRQFADATRYKTQGEADGMGAYGWTGKWETRPNITWRTPGFQQDDSQPVVCVSWNDAQAFCKWLSEKEGVAYQLPTEAQWEYACRGGAKNYAVFGVGDGKTLTSKLANFAGNHPYGCNEKGPYLQRTTPVGSYKLANNFGLLDMHGNVWEWCEDWYDGKYYQNSPKDDPPGHHTGYVRVLRGGSWGDDGSGCRSAFRYRFGPASRRHSVGFRLVLR